MKKISQLITAIIVSLLIVSTCIAKPWRWQGNQGNTYGWKLMNQEERTEHQGKLRSFTEYNACKEYVDEHHKLMEERAKEKGVSLPVMKSNPCDRMRARGVIK